MFFYVFQDDDGNWRWRLATADDTTVAECAKAYARKEDCRAAIQLVKASRMAQVHERNSMWQSSEPEAARRGGPSS